jgi:hypothetical protein
MMRWRSAGLRLAISAMVCVAASLDARADAPNPGPMPRTHPLPLASYASDNPSCLEWTDGCTICAKSRTDAPACSTPGIACQPAGIQCKKNTR